MTGKSGFYGKNNKVGLRPVSPAANAHVSPIREDFCTEQTAPTTMFTFNITYNVAFNSILNFH